MSTKRARELRKTMTKSEIRLWLRLRALRPKGYHFRRQAEFGDFYLDFVCFNHRLVVEVDGPHHDEDRQADHDLMRDAILRRQGFETLRIPSTMAYHEPGEAVAIILNRLKFRPPVRPRRPRAAASCG